MAGIAVKGNGVVELAEDVSVQDGTEVIVVFQERIEKQSKPEHHDPSWLWNEVICEIERRHPELLKMSEAERRADFERLSQKIADNMPYKTVEEFERAMRGDEFGLARY